MWEDNIWWIPQIDLCTRMGLEGNQQLLNLERIKKKS